MGLMDKVKAQATNLAQKTQETATAGMAKLDATQANRRADAMLRSLGVATLAERTGRATAETADQISRLLSDLTAHETQNNINLVQQAAQAAAMQTGPGEFLASSPSPAEASGSFSAAPAGYQSQPDAFGQTGGFPGQSTSFPGGSTSFPDPAAAATLPGQAPATSFPDPAGASFPAATSVPEQAPTTAFPDAAPMFTPEADPAAAAEPEIGPGEVPGFPPAT